MAERPVEGVLWGGGAGWSAPGAAARRMGSGPVVAVAAASSREGRIFDRQEMPRGRAPISPQETVVGKAAMEAAFAYPSKEL